MGISRVNVGVWSGIGGLARVSVGFGVEYGVLVGLMWGLGWNRGF